MREDKYWKSDLGYCTNESEHLSIPYDLKVFDWYKHGVSREAYVENPWFACFMVSLFVSVRITTHVVFIFEYTKIWNIAIIFIEW